MYFYARNVKFNIKCEVGSRTRIPLGEPFVSTTRLANQLRIPFRTRRANLYAR